MSKRNFLILLLSTVLLLQGTACSQMKTSASFSEATRKTKQVYQKDQMIFLKQVVEYYDAEGTPIPRYFELYMAQDKKTAYELDAEGTIIQVYQDVKDRHFSYDLDSMKAVAYDASPLFSLDLNMAAKDKSFEVVKLEPYEYSGRECHVYGLLSDDEDDYIKLYIDDETGAVLFCDSPMFCVKTAFIEVQPYDGGYFGIPEDLDFED